MTNREKVLTASLVGRHFETDREKFIAAIESPEFRYTRARNPSRADGTWTTTDDLWFIVYGVTEERAYTHSLAALPYAEATQILDEHKKVFPLSPTEGL